jgi:hypothetical protein
VAADGVQQLRHAAAGLGRAADAVLGRQPQHVLDLHGHAVGVGRGKVDLVDDRDQLQVVLGRQVGVGDRLSLHPLGGVDHEQGPLAGGEGPGDLVREVHVAGRVDEVELEVLALEHVVHGHGRGLDGDAALPLQVHRVQQLLAGVALGDRAGELQDAIGERGLAVIDVGDDGEVADLHAGRLLNVDCRRGLEKAYGAQKDRLSAAPTAPRRWCARRR